MRRYTLYAIGFVWVLVDVRLFSDMKTHRLDYYAALSQPLYIISTSPHSL